MMRKHLFFVVLLLAMVGTIAAAPMTVSFQGLLTDPTGGVITGVRDLQFSLFGQETGGTALWTETQSVSVSDGIFSVELGSVNPIPDSALAGDGAWLEIKVDTDPPINPRTHLTSVPYSRIAAVLVGPGPVYLSEIDPASGDSGSVLIGRNEESGTNPEYKWEIVNDRPASMATALLQTTVSADSGITEITTAQTATAQATGKRQHRPITIKKAWGATDGSASVELNSMIHADSGFAESRLITSPVGTVEAHENGHALGHGHLDYLKKVGDPATGAIAQQQMAMEPDSGIIESTTTETTTGTCTGVRVHKPFRIYASSSTTNSSDTASWSRSVDSDSGYTERAAMNKADLVTEISHGANQTREHILLSRQVGVPGATTTASLEAENTSDGPQLTMTRQGNASNPEDDGVVILDASVPGGTAFEMTSQNTVNSSSYSAMVSSDSGVVIAVYTNGDTASSMTASSDKRKQSLYFPETMYSALDLLVDGTASMIVLKKLDVTGGAPDSNVVIDNDGNAQLAGQLTIGGTQGTIADATTFTVPRITTSQRDALSAVNGMIIYNTTTNQFNFYENGAWVTK